jgi:hypothetical protein
MSEPQLTTVFYRYNRYAPVIILLYVAAFVTFFFISLSLSPIISAVGFLLLILPPIYGAIRKKSIFSLRRIDERRLTLTPTHIQVGDVQFDVSDLKIALYIGGFEDFRYSKNNKWITQNSIYGDQNHLSFRTAKGVENFQFYLRDYKAYQSLCAVADAWKSAGVKVAVKEQFTREFVRDQVNRRSNAAK